jgi:hypothetical protein
LRLNRDTSPNRFYPTSGTLLDFTAGGGGVRFKLSAKYRVNLRADFAWGRDTWNWGKGVGEAF